MYDESVVYSAGYYVTKQELDGSYSSYVCQVSGTTGVWDSSKWGKRASSVKTYRQFLDAIADEFSNSKNSIPIYKLNKLLGWNMYNFSQFFPTNESTSPNYDGTHPRKGFDRIGMVISNWLILNKRY
jgi:hypothetical protein